MYNELNKDRKIIAAQENIKEKEYWHDKLSRGPVISYFPFMNKDVALKEPLVEVIKFKLEGEAFSKLITRSSGSDYKLHIILLAGLVVLLDKYWINRSSDILIATPIHRPEFDGEFINTVLPLRLQPGPGMTLGEMLKQLSNTIITAAEHQNYPVELLFENTGWPESSPAFSKPDIAVLLENIHHKPHIQPIHPSMIFSFLRKDMHIRVELEYDRNGYEKTLVEQMVTHFLRLLEEVISKPDEPFSGFEVFSEEEKNCLLQGLSKKEAEASTGAGEIPTHTPPRNIIEEKLQFIWSEVLEMEKTNIGIDANFLELNGNSLRTIMLISRIFKDFNVRVPLAEVFKAPTIRGLAGYITGSAEMAYTSIEPAREKEYYVLSPAQKRLYFLQQLDLQSDAYNVPEVEEWTGEWGELTIERLEQTLKKMIVRHEGFRTSFEMVGDKPMQKVHPPHEVGCDIEYYDISGFNPQPDQPQEPEKKVKAIVEGFVRPFDLRYPPLLRVGVIKTPKFMYIMFDIHHIITDAFSKAIFIREFFTLYNGNRVPPLKLQYKDYAEWQNSESQKEVVRQQEAYWLEMFAGDIPALNLPTDFERPAGVHFQGSAVNFKIGRQQIDALNDMALEQGVTLFMLLLAIYHIMFSKITGEKDIVVGTIIAGRRHADLENIVGMFVNTLALRNKSPANITFSQFLQDIKETTLKAFENQDYQFEDLVDKLNVKRTLNRNALFNVLLVVGNIDLRSMEEGKPQLKQKTIGYQNKTSKFDLTLFYHELEEQFELEYSTKLFKEETIKEFIKYFKEIISIIIENRHILMQDINISHHFQESASPAPLMDFEF